MLGLSPSSASDLPLAGPSSRCLDAIVVAVAAACCEKGWYTSTKELQLASLSCCVACRSVRTLRLAVDMSVPHRLWVDSSSSTETKQGDAHSARRGGAGGGGRSSKSFNSSRVPGIKLHTVTWNLPLSMLEWGGGIIANAECLILGGEFNGSLDGVVWPSGLKRLVLGNSFNQPVESASFPPSLKGMGFGASFNKPIENVSWPASLEIVMFGPSFVQPVGGVKWPASLQTLLIGNRRQTFASQPGV